MLWQRRMDGRLPIPPAVLIPLAAQFFGDLFCGFAGLFHGADFEADGAYFRVASAAVAFADGGHRT